MSTALYARISSDDGKGNSVSIHRQLEEIHARAKADALSIPPLFQFVDESKSGRTLNRPAMQALIAQIKAHNIKRLYVYELSRLSRSVRDTEDLFTLFATYGVELIPLYGFFDQSTPEGEFATGIQTQLNRYWSAKTSFSLKRYRKHARESGIYHAHKAPLGLDRQGKFPNITWTINDDFALVLEILQMYVAGNGSTVITRTLNEKGRTWKSGKTKRLPLNTDSVVNLVKYLERYKDFLDPSLYALALSIRAERADRRGNGRRPSHPYALLRGLVVCDVCSTKYYSAHNAHDQIYQWTYYHPSYRRCANPRKLIPRALLDEPMWERAIELATTVLDPQRVRALLTQSPAKTHNVLQDKQAMESRLMEYARLLASKRITEIEYDKLRAETLQSLESLQHEIENAQPEMDTDTLVALCDNLHEAFTSGMEFDPQAANRLMRLLYKEVRVKGLEIASAVIHPLLVPVLDT